MIIRILCAERLNSRSLLNSLHISVMIIYAAIFEVRAGESFSAGFRISIFFNENWLSRLRASYFVQFPILFFSVFFVIIET